MFAFPVYGGEIPQIEVVQIKEERNVKEMIEQYDWDVKIAHAIMMAESSGSSTVVNWRDSHKSCNGSYGLFQIGCLHETNTEILKDPEYNIKRAYELYKESGWRIWGSYTDLRYLDYLTTE